MTSQNAAAVVEEEKDSEFDLDQEIAMLQWCNTEFAKYCSSVATAVSSLSS